MSVAAPDPAWTTRVAALSGIPVPAVRAYGRAQILAAQQVPGCHLGWTTLAGIGWVESQHGTVGGRSLSDSGTSSAPVRGPNLDGKAFAAVRQGAGWANALGPMQFLPSSWRRWGADADGDGRVDVDDLDDAAWAAARYLCADQHDLLTAEGWTGAVRSYNHADAYVAAVHDAAQIYTDRVGG